MRHRPDHRLAGLLALLVLVVSGPWYGSGLANEQPRAALAAALVEEGTIEIGAYTDVLNVDYSIRDGRIYSDKAPGSSLLFVPVYAALDAGGLDLRDDTEAVLTVQAFVLSTLPLAALASLIVLRTRRYSPTIAAATSASIVFGSMLLPFSTLGFGHVLAGFLGLLAVDLLDRSEGRSALLNAAGAAAGLAVLVEYPMVIVALVVVVTAWRRHGTGAAVRVVIGGLPLAAVLLGYHHVAFGNPFHTPYRYAQVFEGEFPGVGVRPPDPVDLVRTLLGERGLWTLTPVSLIALRGFHTRRLLNLHDASQRAIAATVLVGFLLVPAMWVDDLAGTWGGFSPGPRFVVPALPFLAWPLARTIARLPRLSALAATISVAMMTIATAFDPLPPDSSFSDNPAVVHWGGRIRDLDVRPNAFADAFGPVGYLGHLTIVAIALVLIWRTLQPDEPTTDQATGANGHGGATTLEW